jgi:hypothetical protein
MRHALLISVAALALAAASPTLTLAQKQGGAPGASGMGAPAGTAAPAANPSGPNGPTTGAPGAAEQQPSESPAPRATKPDGNRGAQDRTIPDKQRTGEQAPAKQPPQKEGQAAPHEQPGGSKQGAGDQQPGGSKQGAAERPMTTKNVSLTTEQKTTIRTKVLTSSAPRVTNVNFDIKVGVVVPRTVRVAPVPVAIIEIEPTWRGYMYFVSGDEIIIVEPRTLEIVAVLQV